jgi:L-2,4-diaminobutyrate decarboxylase
MDPAALSGELASAGRERVPAVVVATAGTTDFGAIDPLTEIAALCRGYGAWLHVDAAYGGGLLVSRRRRDRLAGIEHADSVTVDFHKTFFQPVSSSAVIVRDRSTLGAVTWHADYLNPSDSANPNQVDKSLQTTRRFDALKLWLTLRVMGPDLVGEYFDTVIDLAAEAYQKLIMIDDLELAAPPYLSTLVLRYRPAEDLIGEDESARLNSAIRSALYDSGSAMVAATTVDGRHFLKLTLLNPKATLDDVLSIVDRIRAIGEELVHAGAAR